MRRKILYGLVLVLVLIQFMKPSRNISNTISANDISKLYPVPDSVQHLLSVACNDCHSNNSVYPWYTNIQPVGWWMQNHVNEGKHDLNFSEFGSYEPEKAAHIMKETAEKVKEKDMPLNSYTWVHKEASLSDQQIKLLVDWSNDIRQSIIQKNNLPPSNKY